MRKLPFVLWMLGWPLVMSVTEYLDYLSSGKPPMPVDSTTVAVIFLVWVGVGALAYEWREP